MTHITLMVVTDGRWRCLRATLDALIEIAPINLFDHWMIVNDALDPSHGDAIDATYHFDTHLRNRSGRKWGFGGAIQTGWTNIPPQSDYVFHLEDDFVIQRYLDLYAMADVLRQHPYLAQLALRRQPWNDVERAAGGIVESHPGEYIDVTWAGHHWLEHRLFFTTNPSLYPAALTRGGWPNGSGSEVRFTQQLLCQDDLRFAFWGRRGEPPWVHHIGEQRIGTGY